MLRHAIAIGAAVLIFCAPSHARVTRIVIDETVSPAFCKGTACTSYGDAGQYEQTPAALSASSTPTIRATSSSRISGSDATKTARFATSRRS